jgi:hypothetical protein
MGTETIKWNSKAWDMKHILDEKTLTIQQNNCHTMTKDWGKRIVTHTDLQAMD